MLALTFSMLGVIVGVAVGVIARVGVGLEAISEFVGAGFCVDEIFTDTSSLEELYEDRISKNTSTTIAVVDFFLNV